MQVNWKEYETRLQAAAIAFASDAGPLAAALNGDKQARTEVTNQLEKAMLENKLAVAAAEDLQA